MKKVGICTLYFKNRNFGANLQAYALCSVIRSLNFESELIKYYNYSRIHRLLSTIKHTLFNHSRKTEKRFDKSAVGRFNNDIPHSKLYYSNNITKANRKYDIFITGSDQVWNPDWLNSFFSLSFVEKSKLTASYAASLGKIKLNEGQQNKLLVALNNTKHISIREAASIPAIKKLTDKEVVNVLDPTLLLEQDSWNNICSERLIKESYMFCYFLADNEILISAAKEYAKMNDLKIVTVPFWSERYKKEMDCFGDIQLFDISPSDFLSLIRFASFVMTTSFHATVFSHIYEREFIVSGGGRDEMGCRISSLTEMFGTSDRYFPEHDMVSFERINLICNEPIKILKDKFEIEKQNSYNFLVKVLYDEK